MRNILTGAATMLISTSVAAADLPNKKQQNPGRSVPCVTPPEACAKERPGSAARSECVHLFLKGNGKREGHPIWLDVLPKAKSSSQDAANAEPMWSSSYRQGAMAWTSSDGRRILVCDKDS